MVQSVSRSRGCCQCLRRKIKYDKDRPAYSHCRRIRKPCPGVYNGLFMVNASPCPSGPPKQASNSFQGSNDITPERAPSCLPAKTSPQHMFEQALWSNFIESFSQSGSKLTQPDSWTRYLLSWISSLKDPWVVDSSNDACLVRTGI